MEIDLIGYSDCFSVAPDWFIRNTGSSKFPSYRAEIARLRHLDSSPQGPGFKYSCKPLPRPKRENGARPTAKS